MSPGNDRARPPAKEKRAHEVVTTDTSNVAPLDATTSKARLVLLAFDLERKGDASSAALVRWLGGAA